MTLALVTVIAPVAPNRVPDLQHTLDGYGNPAQPAISAALEPGADGLGTHFLSLHAVHSCDGRRGHILLELSADGTDRQALERLAAAIGPQLQALFVAASDWTSGRSLIDYLMAHRVSVGPGWFDNPGAVFAGTPGLSVGRIRAEAGLAGRVASLIGQQPANLGALARLEGVRTALAGDPCLQPAPPPPPYNPATLLEVIFQMLGAFAVTFLWPVGVLLAISVVVTAVLAPTAGAMAEAVGWEVVTAFLLVLLAAAIAVVRLRDAEASDFVDARTASRANLAAMFERENHCAHNHMISITERKPGLLRKFTSRLIFWAVGQLVARSYQPGFLSDIGTIHFARWVTPPGTPDLLFFSNYDGSWESYLEEFITRAHAGLTGVWSNSVGFPRTKFLIQDGATNAERFKRYARHSMQPTRFWYSAYPQLTTTEIRTNAAIRQGLNLATTEDEARVWLAQFGSAVRPPPALVSSEIQSLVFGGLRFKPHGVCLIVGLPPTREAARDWLQAIRPHIAFNDGRRLAADAVLTLALGAPGLAKLGLPQASLETFPFAFTDGMTNPGRSRLLGDTGTSAPEHWHWGQEQPDAALLVYGKTPAGVAALQAELEAAAQRCGASTLATIGLKEITEDKTEPFGFVDGISQPLIRGTYKALKQDDSIHLVEAGEFILGYPDNRGNRPPGPTLPATLDPANLLPLVTPPDGFSRAVVEAPRDLGCNGSFLVIRQLEQNRQAFNEYCEKQARELAGRLPPPYRIDAEFIAAKLVGRWRDGSSLVRFPYQPRSTTHDRRVKQEVPLGLAAPGKVHHHHADNGFRFGVEDPEALRCPLGAHIRRANPRDSLDPGSDEELAIVNRHRIIRVGRQYQEAEGRQQGLLFMCLNSDIERQFEFVQQTWLGSPAFHGLSCEKDPLLGDGDAGACGFTIPSRDGPLRLSPMQRFITTRGGGYFFLPGKRLLDYLGA